MHLQLHHPTAVLQGDIGIESSKSISNRALIINALTNNKCTLTHLSTANDTLLLQRLLAQQTTEYNAEDAGTTFRFLTAYLSIQPFDSTLTGTSRMMQRPIAPLVDALRQIGATIQYLKNEGFPPLKILGSKFRQQTSTVAIRADISSQFISALLLIAPRLPKGLHINLEGFVTSEPYINMTLAIMQYFSIRYQQTPHTIIIEHQAYQPKLLAVEADWSSAAYYYAMAGIAQSAHIRLRGLTQNSWQGDAVIASIATFFGVHTYYKNNYIEIKKAAEQLPKSKLFEYDFSNAPDIAPTVIILCAALG
ncbi:MAG: 3-phosphoshikimate 1-carboxyvinyltransferase, partial [Saprospiraceae bacterium]